MTNKTEAGINIDISKIRANNKRDEGLFEDWQPETEANEWFETAISDRALLLTLLDERDKRIEELQETKATTNTWLDQRDENKELTTANEVLREVNDQLRADLDAANKRIGELETERDLSVVSKVLSYKLVARAETQLETTRAALLEMTGQMKVNHIREIGIKALAALGDTEGEG